jgi:hypothetical protein
MAIGTAAAIGIGLAGAGSILGSKSQSKAAKTAANTELQVAQQNNALAANIYGQNKDTLNPYVQRGNAAGNALNSMLGIGDPNIGRNAFKGFIENSDYGFQFGEGANKVNSGYAGAGTLQSGAAMKGLEDYRQNLQAGYRGEFNQLLGNQQGVGLAGGSALAGVGQNYVNTVSANNQNAGDAAANAALIKGANNPWANSLSLLGGGLFGMAG